MTNDDILKKNEKFSEILSEKLNLNCEPVAIKFFNNIDEIPENIEKLDKKIRHCEMVRAASYGEKFYTTANEQSCKGGSATLGLEDFPEKLITGEKYFSLGRFDSIENSKKTLDEVPKIKTKHLGIIYSPLKEANFTPDNVVILASPKIGMKIAQSVAYSGKRVNASFAGIQSLCGDIVAGPYTTGDINFSLGCDGSRKFADVKDEELSIGINNNNLEEIVNNLDSI